MITITIKERITSILFQLALDAALSSATVVAKVNPFSCSSDGLSVSKLTMIIQAKEKMNNHMQKYRKFKVAKS